MARTGLTERTHVLLGKLPKHLEHLEHLKHLKTSSERPHLGALFHEAEARLRGASTPRASEDKHT